MKRLLLALACAWLVPAATRAQQPDTVRLTPIVVTATRLPTPADQVPAAVTVLEGSDLRAQGIRTVADALRTVPGAAVVTTDAYGSVTSLFLRGGESDYVKVLIDGVPQNAPGGGYDFANLTTDDVERIEVVRGPVSVLYGSDAVTGVVQIFTREGRGPARVSLETGRGTYGTSDLRASVAGGTDRGGYALTVSRLASDGVYPANNQYHNDVLTSRLRLRLDDRTDAAVSLRYGDALYHFPTDYKGDTVSNNQHQLDRGPSVGVDVGRRYSERVEGHLSALWHRDNYQYAIAPNDSGDTTTFPYSSSDWVTRAGLDARGNVRLSTHSVLTAGAAFERQSMEGTTLDTMRSRNDRAAYLQLVSGPGAPLNVTLGTRLEDNERFGTYATYRVGSVLRLGRWTRGSVSVGTGFKEPTFYQNYATGYVHGNPNLAPEHSFSWETGLEVTLPHTAVTARVTYFNQRFRDLIDYNGIDTVTSYFNVPGADARGIELAADGPISPHVHANLAYTYLDTRVTKGGADSGATALFLPGHPLVRRPRHAGTLGLVYRPATGGSAAFTASYTGRREDVDYAMSQRVTLPAYLRVDAGLDYELLPPHGSTLGLGVSARVENVFDRVYEDVKNFPARRRTFFVGARLGLAY